MIPDSTGVPIRAGLCLDCSTRLVWWNGRLRCNTKDVNMQKFPTKSCNSRHPLAPGQKPQRVHVVHPDTELCFEHYDKDLERCQICSRDSICMWRKKQKGGTSS